MNSINPGRLAIIMATLCMLLTSGTAFAKRYYRFEDARGKIRVLDYLPAEAAQNEYEIVDEKGAVIQKVGRAMTVEEIVAEQQKQKELEEKSRIAQEKRRRDALLLRQFYSIDDILRAQDSQLNAIDINIAIQKSKNLLLKAQLFEMQERAAELERSGKPLPASLTNPIAASQAQIVDNLEIVGTFRDEKRMVQEQFKSDLVRFKELKAKQLVNRNLANLSRNFAKQIYTCSGQVECNKAWQLSQLFAHEHATGKLEIITDTLILSSKPRQDKDISLSLARIPEKEDRMQIVLEVDCFDSTEGNAFCESQAVEEVKQEFVPYLSSKLD